MNNTAVTTHTKVILNYTHKKKKKVIMESQKWQVLPKIARTPSTGTHHVNHFFY